jgi:hypothetical protein
MDDKNLQAVALTHRWCRDKAAKLICPAVHQCITWSSACLAVGRSQSGEAPADKLLPAAAWGLRRQGGLNASESVGYLCRGILSKSSRLSRYFVG